MDGVRTAWLSMKIPVGVGAIGFTIDMMNGSKPFSRLVLILNSATASGGSQVQRGWAHARTRGMSPRGRCDFSETLGSLHNAREPRCAGRE